MNFRNSFKIKNKVVIFNFFLLFIAIQCPPPIAPLHGQLVEAGAVPTAEGGKYAVGSLVQFTCDGAHLLEGEASIVCTETGFWSHPPPFCKY